MTALLDALYEHAGLVQGLALCTVAVLTFAAFPWKANR